MPRLVQVLLRCYSGRATVPVVPSLHGCCPSFTHPRGAELSRALAWWQWAPALSERLGPVLWWALWVGVCLLSGLCSAERAFQTKQGYQKQLILSLSSHFFHPTFKGFVFSKEMRWCSWKHCCLSRLQHSE